MEGILWLLMFGALFYFDFKHFADIERLAMVGEKKWEEWMAKFCRPFTNAEIRYFDQSQAEEARSWIAGD